MFIFGHTGITVGTAMVVDALTRRRGASWPSTARGAHPLENGKVGARPRHLGRGFFPIRAWLDYRLLLVASLLPDIIDKPLGQLVLKNSISYGRIYGHTILFVLVTGLLGLWLFKNQRRGWLLTAAFGSLMHDLEDQMWRWPEVWWWPLEGWSFPKEDLTGWFSNMFHALVSAPDVFPQELVGIGVLVFVAVKVLHSKRFLYALKTGRIDPADKEVLR